MNSHTSLAVLIGALLLITACGESGESGNSNTGNGNVTNNNQRNFR